MLARRDFKKAINFSRASKGAYWDANRVLRFAEIDELRFDHHPDTGELRGVLFEEQRTNYVNYCANEGDWSISISGGTTGTAEATENFATAPDGTNSATRFVASLGDANSVRMAIPIGFSGNATGKFQASIFLKSNNGLNQTMYVTNTGGIGLTQVEVGPSWKRYIVPADLQDQAVVTMRVGLSSESDTDCDVLVWGAQFEEGSFASSLILTSGAPATRAGEEAYISPISSWLSDQAEMTLLADWERSQAGSSTSLVFHSIRMDGHIGGGFFGFYNAMNLLVYTGSDSVEVETFGIGKGEFAKTGFSVSGDTIVAAVNGVSKQGAPGKSYSNIVNQTKLELSRANGSPGWLKRIRYFDYAMTSEELEDWTK